MREVVPKTVETYLTRNGKDVFQKWLNGLADLRAKALIDKTVAKVRLGNLGQHKSVGEGVQKIVLDYGPGYRIYFGEHGSFYFAAARKRDRKKRSKRQDNIGRIGKKGL
jgi:putative addiction module killer protein